MPTTVRKIHIWSFHIRTQGVEIRIFFDTYERAACANRRMRIGTSEIKKKVNFTRWKQKHFTFLCFFLILFLFDNKSVIKRKTSGICMDETVPYINGTSDGTIVKWNINGDFKNHRKWTIKSKTCHYNQCEKVGGIFF